MLYTADCHLSDVKQFCNVALIYCSQKVLDGANVLFFQLGVLNALAVNVASFFNGIVHVVLAGADKHVRRIYALWPVSTGAIMAKLHAFWNWANHKLPNHPMRFFGSVVACTVSVPLTQAPGPQPTGFRFIDISPDASRNTFPFLQARTITKRSLAIVNFTSGHKPMLPALSAFHFNSFGSFIQGIAGPRAEFRIATWTWNKQVAASLANTLASGRCWFRHNELLSFCLGGAGRFAPLHIADNLTITAT